MYGTIIGMKCYGDMGFGSAGGGERANLKIFDTRANRPKTITPAKDILHCGTNSMQPMNTLSGYP